MYQEQHTVIGELIQSSTAGDYSQQRCTAGRQVIILSKDGEIRDQ